MTFDRIVYKFLLSLEYLYKNLQDFSINTNKKKKKKDLMPINTHIFFCFV